MPPKLWKVSRRSAQLFDDKHHARFFRAAAQLLFLYDPVGVLRSVSEHYRKSILKWFQSWRRFCLNMEKVDIANYLFFGTQFTRCLDGTKRPSCCNKILEQIISWHNNNFWLIFLCSSQETGIFLVKLITVQHEKFDEGWLL